MYKIKFSLFTLFFTLMVSTLWADVEINEKNFPDNDFRNFLLHQSYGKDKILTEAEIASITEISVGGENYDGVKNMKGIEFFFALEKLDCCECCVSELDVSKNTALTYLDCDDNLLTELDVSNNTALTYIDCSRNKLIALELPKNATFTWLDCSYNQIKGMAMDDLIESLPSISKGTMRVIGRGSEKNVMTKRQVADAKAKGWVPQYDDDDYWRDYAGNKDYEIFSGGNGTEANPYIINTPSDFNMLAEEVNSGNTCEGRYFKVEKPEIDFKGLTFKGIGSGSSTNNQDPKLPFSGFFDGNNVVIKNLLSNKGLFGYLGKNGTITGVVIDESCTITGNTGDVAGIAGVSFGTISDCVNRASVTGSHRVGGICGDCMGKIINCKNYGTINGTSDFQSMTGGIAGDIDGGTVLNCENYGDVIGVGGEVGGIVGLLAHSTFTDGKNKIEGCFNKGNIKGSHNVGGVYGSSSSITSLNNNLVAGCEIYLTDSRNGVGAISGSGLPSFSSNNFYTADVIVKADNIILSGLMARAYCSYSYQANKVIGRNMKDNNGGMLKFAIEDFLTSYAENSYEIKSVEDMKILRDLTNEVELSLEGLTFRVTAQELDFRNTSLTIGQYCTRDENNNNQPTYKPFCGVFAGNGVVIKRLLIRKDNNVSYNYNKYSLFAYNKGTVKDVILDESCSTESSGGIVSVNEGIITGCINRGVNYNGGIASTNSGTISNNFVVIKNSNKNLSGAIVYTNNGSLENNFYRYNDFGYLVTGTNGGDISDKYGAVRVYTLSSSDDKTEIVNQPTSGVGIITMEETTYYANGLTINANLNYMDEIPEGYKVVFSHKYNSYSDLQKALSPNEDGTYSIKIENQDVVINTKIEPRIFKLTYYVDGEEYRSQEFHYTDSIRPLPEPQKQGYTFSSWSGIPETMPAHDVKVTGTFTFTGKLNNVEIGGIHYNVDATTKEAEVCRNQNLYSGDIVIPSSVQFEGSTYSVTSIAAASFWGCMGLTSIEIPNSVAAIGNNTFYGCSNLKSIVSKIQVPFTYNNAFDGLSYNCVLTVPDGTKSAYFAAGWTNDVFKGGVVESSESSEEIIDFADANVKAICVSKWDTNKDGELSVREAAVVSDLGEVFTGKTEITSFNEFKYFTSLTKINSFVFENCSGLTSITIPHNVTSLGSGSFRNCTGLKSILIPNNVTSIEARAFYGCTSLSSITVAEDNPVYDSRDNCNAIIETQSNTLISGCINTIILNGVTSIGASAFGGCSGLTSIEIPNSVYSIGEYAFSGSGLTSIEIPNGVTSIGNNAFQDCSGLTSIEIPNGVTSIGNNAFQDCSGLTSIEISNSVTSIGDFAFAECSGLTSIKIPEGVTSIGTYAFGYCYLTSIEISSSVTSIGEWAFGDCDDIISISVAEGNPVYDSRDNCNAIIETKSNTLILGCRNTVIPNSVLSIGKFAFQSCNLSHIDIPQSITTIGDYAFRGNAFTILTIPENVTSIGEEAFSYNENLKEVYCNAPKVPETSNNAFSSGVDLSTVTLYLPEEELVALYKAQAPWKNFGKIVAVQGTEPTSPIIFADTRVKAVCVANWDADGNGKLSMAEAAAVTDLGTAFKGNTAITSFKELKFFTGLTKISAHAFGGCKGLTSVEIPNNVTSIDEGAFYGSGLTSIFIPDSVSHIGSGAFSYCRNLLNLVVDENNPVYDSRDDSNALIETSTNTLVHATGNSVVPNSITRIGDGAFVDYTIKTTLEIPEGVTHIGQNVFPSTLSSLVSKMKVPVRYDSFFENVPYNCSLSIPFGTSAVYIAAGWTEDIFKGGIKESGDIIFADANVKALCVANWDKNGDGELSVAEAEVVRNLGAVFANNKDIKSFNELKYFTGLELIAKHVFSGCTNLSYIKLPNNLTTIGESAFSGCKGLMYIDLPNSVNTIGNGAFNECASLTYIVLPEQVKSVGSYAFAGCKKLMDVYCYATSVPATGRDPFPNVSTATLHVPEVSIDEYRAANFWSNFYKIVPIEPIFTLLYMIDDNVYMSYKVEEGTAIIPLDMPSKEGYTFEWKELPDVMPAHDVTVYGSYSINKYKLIYMVNDTEYKTIEAEYGSAITPESEPIKEGYIFSGWSEIPDTMPAHDVTVTGTLTRYYIVGDVPKVVNFIMNSNATPDDIALYDVNNDSELDIGDVILIVRYLLDNGGSTLNRVTKRRAPGISDITQYTAAQFNLVVDKNTTIKSIRLVGSMKQTHQLMCKQIDETTYSVVVFSLSNQLLNPESGSIVTVETDGEDVNIQNMIVATSSGESYYYQNDDVITNIFPLTNSNKSKECYDLKGYRVNESNLKKGSIVIYGKKVLVK